jgi:hypothetical protein
MKRCKTCGKLNWDGAKECEACHIPFIDKPVVTPQSGNQMNFPLIIGIILILVGVVLLVIDLIHIRINSMSILYMAAGGTLISTRTYHEQNDKAIEVLQSELNNLKDELKKLKEKNAD